MRDDGSEIPQKPTLASGGYNPVEYHAGRDELGVLFICDHASNALPAAFGTLGLRTDDLTRHIAYDIGAAWVTRKLAAIFEAPAVLTTFSRLLIDPNRGADDPTLVPKLSDSKIIPGNATADEAEFTARLETYWKPYRQAVSAQIEAMLALGVVPVVISMHSFTPVWRDERRPWEVGILWDSDNRLAEPLMAALAADGVVTGDNEPYDGALTGDTLDEEVTRRGLAGLLIEVRQDLIASQAQAEAWAERLARILKPLLADPELREHRFVPSRTGRHLTKT
jgi:predicted N-formylglutamate amidohydrolase